MPSSFRRVVLVILIVIVTLSACTLSPLLSLWLASLVQDGAAVTKVTSLLTVIVALASLSLLHLKVILILNTAYEREAGIVRTRTPLGWLRSARDSQHEDRPATAPEKVLVVLVLLILLALAVWFFVFARSPLPSQ